MISQTVRKLDAHRVRWRVQKVVWGESSCEEVGKEGVGEEEEIELPRPGPGVIAEAGGEEEAAEEVADKLQEE